MVRGQAACVNPERIGVVVVDQIPRARRRRWSSPIVAAVVLVVSAPNILEQLDGGPSPATTETTVCGIVLGLALLAAFLWMFYRPGQQLHRAMVKANPNLLVVPVYSSDDFIRAIEQLNGSRLTSSNLPAGAFLVFVDAGRQFELWKSHHRKVERVIRLPWVAVDSIEIDVVSHPTTVDRAFVLNVKTSERNVRIPISPQECRAVRLAPVKDRAFHQLLAQFKSRVATHQRDADSRLPHSTAQPSSETP